MTVRRILPVLGLLLLGACAPSSYVILLPDDSGTVGKVVVTGKAGSQVIDQASTGTSIDGSTKAPFAVTENEIKATFGRALAAQPQAPVSFMLHFLSDQTELVAESERDLPEIIRVIKARTAPDISIIGHSDRFGDRAYNEQLGLGRAKAVRGKLVERGVAAEQIVEVTSHGENNPLIPTADGVREPRNRRVEVTVR